MSKKFINTKLKPPKGLRSVTPRVCATCLHGLDVDDYDVPGFEVNQCMRPNGPVMNTQQLEDWYYVCDYYKSYPEDTIE